MLVAQMFASVGLVGLMWFLQVVHYPLFTRVGNDRFFAYELTHRWLVAFVVSPFMCVEAIAAAWLVVDTPPGISTGWAIVGLSLIAVPHLSTLFVQVPLHHKLSANFDPVLVRRLVRSQWIRTLAWTARGVLSAGMLMAVMPG